ncbi:basic salivary proline-rich protein 1-like [Neopelma chrysocephalum]|uniref:basic salivary proline-rich protein 1-like n=1 Tax=Neopelma chrysocephalum TaxID=114329 RepID=UPI000FCD318D|nr:basic salivary proline-rich protein 1-like [Neopelma chrysocephalum]
MVRPGGAGQGRPERPEPFGIPVLPGGAPTAGLARRDRASPAFSKPLGVTGCAEQVHRQSGVRGGRRRLGVRGPRQAGGGRSRGAPRGPAPGRPIGHCARRRRAERCLRSRRRRPRGRPGGAPLLSAWPPPDGAPRCDAAAPREAPPGAAPGAATAQGRRRPGPRGHPAAGPPLGDLHAQREFAGGRAPPPPPAIARQGPDGGGSTPGASRAPGGPRPPPGGPRGAPEGRGAAPAPAPRGGSGRAPAEPPPGPAAAAATAAPRTSGESSRGPPRHLCSGPACRKAHLGRDGQSLAPSRHREAPPPPISPTALSPLPRDRQSERA